MTAAAIKRANVGRFSYTPQDLEEARSEMERVAWRRPEVIAVFWSPVLFTAGCVILVVSGVTAALAALLIPFLWFLAAWRSYRAMFGIERIELGSEEEKRLPRFNECLAQASDEGVRVEGAVGWTLYRWSCFRRLRLTPTLVILTDDRQISLVLPRRAIADVDHKALMALVALHLR